ncbi:CrcB protein [Thermoanaerobacter mathranii subsp. mathranii str. A3]|jgi:CrcB protein|uniref:Fluoride-specific ion channel FluC n=2 Tax=Thermoanaerobacter TaxID=1754 RepID=A0ABT9M6R8_9THEO|nr:MULTISPECIES: fluoride efflux transporter CrcB [Thermoanaerobacter]ADH59889.1 CrcB protein [Thermoanaerobacter mathranii subsp. mathranii str. A3]MDP9751816.1 CrcB protein [Thermoanaerobacter pentosaceus]
MIKSTLYVGIGGFFGAILRYEISRHIKEKRQIIIPIETFIINVLGSFLLNFLSSPKINVNLDDDVKLFLTTGFLGAFTTYSTFSHETIDLIKNKKYFQAFKYMALTIVFGLIGGVVGYYIGNCVGNLI